MRKGNIRLGQEIEIGSKKSIAKTRKSFIYLCMFACCIENSGQENKKTSYSGASLEQSALLHCQHRLGGGYLVNYYPRTALDIFRWLGLPQILKIRRQQKIWPWYFSNLGVDIQTVWLFQKKGWWGFIQAGILWTLIIKKLYIHIIIGRIKTMQPHLKFGIEKSKKLDWGSIRSSLRDGLSTPYM